MRTTMMMVIEEAKKKCNTHHLTHSNSPTSYSDHLRRHHHQPMHADARKFEIVSRLRFAPPGAPPVPHTPSRLTRHREFPLTHPSARVGRARVGVAFTDVGRRREKGVVMVSESTMADGAVRGAVDRRRRREGCGVKTIGVRHS